MCQLKLFVKSPSIPKLSSRYIFLLIIITLYLPQLIFTLHLSSQPLSTLQQSQIFSLTYHNKNHPQHHYYQILENNNQHDDSKNKNRQQRCRGWQGWDEARNVCVDCGESSLKERGVAHQDEYLAWNNEIKKCQTRRIKNKIPTHGSSIFIEKKIEEKYKFLFIIQLTFTSVSLLWNGFMILMTIAMLWPLWSGILQKIPSFVLSVITSILCLITITKSLIQNNHIHPFLYIIPFILKLLIQIYQFVWMSVIEIGLFKCLFKGKKSVNKNINDYDIDNSFTPSIGIKQHFIEKKQQFIITFIGLVFIVTDIVFIAVEVIKLHEQ